MIELRNVSKFYYKKGMIASGISRINLKLDLGEFVVITGESGSGKSTLLNVISGMDSYEEGEMYIDGRETSHFMEKDFAEYRKRYIGNVFQEFNLIGSYTVYQNVELVLLINGFKRPFVRQRVREILQKVGMDEHAGTKVSKLSGGQMQRVAIARALAKETDIIVADEPTGNLDSGSAAEIVSLLREISKDKLVIVVTHNFEQFRSHATRMIKMHDGRIAEDVRLANRQEIRRDISETPEEKVNARVRGKDRSGRQRQTGRLSAGSRLRLGLRNTFNVAPKFFLLLIVFGFLLTAVTSQYTSYLSQKDEASKLGFNNYFSNLSLDRLVVKKDDGSSFDAGDYDAISSVYNVRSVAEYDILIDSPVYLEDKDFSYAGVPRSAEEMTAELIAGRMPEKNGEIVLAAEKDDSSADGADFMENLNRVYEVETDTYGTKEKLTVVGLAYREESPGRISDYSDIYMSRDMMDRFLANTYHSKSRITVRINGKDQVVDIGDTTYDVMPCGKVAKGEAVVPPETGSFFKDNECRGKDIRIRASNIFRETEKTVRVKAVYSEKNYGKLTGRNDFGIMNGVIFVHPDDYAAIFSPDNFQATVYVDEIDGIGDTKNALTEMGYTVLPLKDVLIPVLSDVMQMVQLPIAIAVIIALFFITYFVIRLILRSRTGYFSILRMLGMSRKTVRRIMDVELLTVMTIAFALFFGLAMLVTYDIVHVDYIKQMVKYMTPAGYAVLYGIMLVMSYLISGKFSRSLFKDSAMTVYREEV